MHNSKRALILSAGLTLAIAAAELSAIAAFSYGQALPGTGTSVSTKPAPSPSLYIAPNVVPSSVRRYAMALGSRVLTSGNERMVLTGTIAGSVVGVIQITWQAPGAIQVSLPGAISLAFDPGPGLANASAVSQSNADLLESVLDDSEESFVYGFMQGEARRLIASHARPAGAAGAAAAYSGPFYDVFGSIAPVKAQAGNPQRPKYYYVDSTTGLLARTDYQAVVAGAETSVETQFNNWSSASGQSFPRQIVRLENGKTVFTITVVAATFGPLGSTAIFLGGN